MLARMVSSSTSLGEEKETDIVTRCLHRFESGRCLALLQFAKAFFRQALCEIDLPAPQPVEQIGLGETAPEFDLIQKR